MNAHRGNSILSDIGAFQREKNCSRTGEENNGRRKILSEVLNIFT